MMTFSFSFDDYEEAEIGLAAFAETCRQLKTTLKRKPKSVEKPVTVTKATLGDGLVGNRPDDLLPPLPEKSAVEPEAPAPEVTTPAPTQKRKAKAKAEPKADALAGAVKAVTLQQLRDLGNEIIAKEGGKGAKKVGAILRQFNGARQFPDVPEDQYGAAYAKLQAAALNDEIPF